MKYYSVITLLSIFPVLLPDLILPIFFFLLLGFLDPVFDLVFPSIVSLVQSLF